MNSHPAFTQRLTESNSAPIRREGEFVLYWMIAFRRVSSNFALDRAIEWAKELRKPLVIFEPLRVGYQWASERLHQFVIDGMAENSARVAERQSAGVFYYPYVEPRADAGKGLLAALAARACVVVTDDFPSFFLPRMVNAAASRLSVRLETIDSNGLLPLRATDRVFTTAFSFRAFLQKQLPRYLVEFPQADPLMELKLPALPALPSEILERWPMANGNYFSENTSPKRQRVRSSEMECTHSLALRNCHFGEAVSLSELPIDHSVGVVATRGGTSVARQKLSQFLQRSLPHYAAGANDPDADNRSGLSPYLHFGHISSHELFRDLMAREEWSPASLGEKTGGKREGWWGVSAGAEAWLDEFITWRELGFNMSSKRADYDQYESLPDWAQATLAKHANDPREYVYSLDEFAAAATHDELWNAAQTQLMREGRMHNYLRMLWGKKILEWSATPRDALATMIELNNRYALDGRNPNSYSGIFWTLGRYDRAWGPERPIFGNIRYMSSDSTRRKLQVREYLQRYQNPSSTK